MKNSKTLLCTALLFGACATQQSADSTDTSSEMMTPAAPGGGAMPEASMAIDGKAHVVLFVETMGQGWNDALTAAVTQHVHDRVGSQEGFDVVSQERMASMGALAIPSASTMSESWLAQVEPMFTDLHPTVFVRIALHLNAMPQVGADGSVQAMPRFTVATQCVDMSGVRRCENVMSGGADEHMSLIEYAVRDLHVNTFQDVLAAPMK